MREDYHDQIFKVVTLRGIMLHRFVSLHFLWHRDFSYRFICIINLRGPAFVQAFYLCEGIKKIHPIPLSSVTRWTSPLETDGIYDLYGRWNRRSRRKKFPLPRRGIHSVLLRHSRGYRLDVSCNLGKKAPHNSLTGVCRPSPPFGRYDGSTVDGPSIRTTPQITS